MTNKKTVKKAEQTIFKVYKGKEVLGTYDKAVNGCAENLAKKQAKRVGGIVK